MGPLVEHATIHQRLSCLLAPVPCTCSTATRRLTFNTIGQHCSMVLVAIQPKSGSGIIMWWSSGLLQLPNISVGLDDQTYRNAEPEGCWWRRTEDHHFHR